MTAAALIRLTVGSLLGMAAAHGAAPENRIRCVAFKEPIAAEDDSLCVFALSVSSPPRIDGALDDACWRDTAPATGFVEHHAPTPRPIELGQTAIRWAYTDDTLFMAARCTAAAPGQIRRERDVNDRDGDVFRDDCLELILVVGTSEMRFVLTAGGARGDSLEGDSKWNPEWLAAVSVGDAEWTAEIAIPFAALVGRRPPQPDDPGSSLRFNVGRSTAPIRLVSSLFPGYDDPNRMGSLVVGTPDQWRARGETRRGIQVTGTSLLLDKWAYDSADRAVRGRLRLNEASRSTVGPSAVRVRFSVLGAGSDDAVWTLLTDPLKTAVVDFEVDVKELPAGEYRVLTELLGDGDAVLHTSKHPLTRKVDPPELAQGAVPLIIDLPDATAAAMNAGQRVPIYAGVPLPRNAKTRNTSYRLYDSRGRELVAQTQPLTVWAPDGNTQWLGLRFLAESPDVARCELRFGEVAPAAPLSWKPIDVQHREGVILVDTGPLRFEVLERGFDGLHRAWFDADGNGTVSDEEQVLAEPNMGPTIRDAGGTIYSTRLDSHSDAVVESPGPLCVVIRCSGWYMAEDGGRICRHVTRLVAHAGLPWIRVFHTFVFCADSREVAISGISWPVRLQAPKAEVRFGGDPRPIPLSLAAGEAASLLQHESDAFMLRRSSGSQATVLATGAKADGWVEAFSAGTAVAIGMRDFAATYPRELEARRGEAVLHLWPRNGFDKPVKQPTDDDLSELWFLHHRRLLDFQVPEWFSGFQSSGPFVDKEHERSRHRYVRASAATNGMGVARSCEFYINFRSPDQDNVRAVWACVNEPPLAAAAPVWMCQSGVFGPLAPVDRRSFPVVEQALDLRHDGERTIERYSIGMFNYGGSTSYFRPRQRSYDQLERPWRLTHHGSPRVPWLLFARSGDRKFADYALRHGSWCADIGFCHYSTPALERYGLDGKVRGGQCDYKGIVPWSRGGRVMDYNSIADFLLWMTCFSGDRWPLEVADEWGRCVKQRFRPWVGRSAAGSLDTLLSLYEITWDMDYRELAERQFLAIADKEFLPSGYFRRGLWYDYAPWLAHYHRFTASGRATEIAVAWTNRLLRDCWLGDGTFGEDTKFVPEMGYPLYDVFGIAFEATKDPRMLAIAHGCSVLPALSTVSAPGSDFHGFETYSTASHGGYYTQTVPYILPLLEKREHRRALFPPWTLHGRRIQFFVRAAGEGPLELRVRLVPPPNPGKVPLPPPLMKIMDEYGRVEGPKPVEVVRVPVRERPDEALKDGENDHGFLEYARIAIPDDMRKGTTAVVLAYPGARHDIGVRLPMQMSREASLVFAWDQEMRFGRGSAVYFSVPRHASKVTLKADSNYWQAPHMVAVLNAQDELIARQAWQPVPGNSAVTLTAEVSGKRQGEIWSCVQGLTKYVSIDLLGPGIEPFFADRPERFFIPRLRQ
jgi:hypothetical protein